MPEYKRRKAERKRHAGADALEAALVASTELDRAQQHRKDEAQLEADHVAKFRRDMMDYLRLQDPQRPLALVMSEVTPMIDAELKRFRAARAELSRPPTQHPAPQRTRRRAEATPTARRRTTEASETETEVSDQFSSQD